MEKFAVYTGSRNLYDAMVPAVKSLLANTDVDRVYLLIEDAEFPHWLPDEVEAIDVSGQRFFDAGGPNMSSQFTWLSMMRAALCHVLPGVDLVLSLDVDTVAIRDARRAWEVDVEGRYFAASMEAHRTHDGLLYTNTGVALYNLEMLRDGKADEVISVLNSRRYTWVEQDVFNYLCQGRIAEMPSEFNASEWTAPCASPKIVHYAGHREWAGRAEVSEYRALSWDEVWRRRARLS